MLTICLLSILKIIIEIKTIKSNSSMIDKPVVIGLYGCYCHPFKDWNDLKNHEKQKLFPGDIVKHRCTGKEGEILGKTTENFYPQDGPMYTLESKNFYRVKYGPLARDIQSIVVQNAIVIKRKPIEGQLELSLK